MANQTVTTAVNYDDASISGLLNGEDLTLNAGTVTVDADMRWAQQAAVVGNVTISATLGGLFHLDGSKVWEIAFDASSGNVPTLNALGSNGVTGGTSGATGELIRVWAAGELEPRAAGGAMPTAGWIKLRSKTGTFQDNETITLPGGATVTVNSATGGKRSWIHVVGEYQGLITVPRLGEFRATGDWYEIGQTNGTDDQVIPLPVADAVPGIWIETGAGSGVYTQWENAGLRWATATQFIPTDTRGTYFGQWFTRGSMGSTNGSAVVTTTDTSGFAVGAPVIMSAGWANTDRLFITAINPGVSITLSANANATGTQTITTVRASITLAQRASNACGLKPPTGCRIRIPNIIISTSESNFAGNTSRGTLGDRWETATTSAGVIALDHVCAPGLYLNCTSPYTLEVEDSCFGNTIIVSNVASFCRLTNVIVGMEANREATPVQINTSLTEVTMAGVRATRYASSGTQQQCIQVQDCANLTMTACYGGFFGSTTAVTRGNSDARSIFINRTPTIVMTDCVAIGGRINLSQSSDITVTGTQFADQLNGATVSTNPLTGAFDITNTCTDGLIDGFSNFAGLANVHPYASIIALGGSASGWEIRNIGTPATPYDCGSANQCARIAALSSTQNNALRRLYAVNTRTDTLSIANTAQNTVIDNVWGDAADSQAIAGLAVTARGCRWTNSTTGQASCYGRHWEDAFTGTTTGRILIACNEPLPSTTGQVSATLGAGAGFTSTGQVAMPNLTDVVIWEMPYFALGHTSLANIAPTITGTNTANFTLEFQWDTGSGWNGSWLALTGANLSGVGAIDSSTGIKLKVRATVNTADPTNALTYIRIDTVTNATDQQIQYPLPVVANLGIVDGFMANSRIIVYNETTDTVIYDDRPASAPLTLTYDEGTDFTTGDTIRVYHVWYNNVDGSTATKKGRLTAQAGATGWSVLVEQETCTTYGAYYSTFGTTGAAVYATGEFARDGVNLQIDINDPDNNWFAHRMFMWDKYDLWLNSGRRAFFLQISATDAGNLSIGTLLLDNLSASTAKQGDEINVVNSTSTLPVVNPTTGGGGLTMYSGGKILTTTSGGLSPSEAQIKAWVRAELATEMARIDASVSTRLAAADYDDAAATAAVTLAAMNAAPPAVNVAQVNDIAVVGTGTELDPWSPA
jgi:hypothetical protein